MVSNVLGIFETSLQCFKLLLTKIKEFTQKTYEYYLCEFFLNFFSVYRYLHVTKNYFFNFNAPKVNTNSISFLHSIALLI